MKFLLALLAVVAIAYAISSEDVNDFKYFLKLHKRTYSNEEYSKRLDIFAKNKLRVNELNERAASSGRNTQFALNQFSDLSADEFKAMFMGYKKKASPVVVSNGKEVQVNVSALPAALDWRKKGAVTPVKNQGQCGSCWAFSATEGVESAWFLAGHPLVALSPQQVVSCDDNDDGCDGGDLPTAFGYIQQAGLETGADYPYTSGGGNTGYCNYNAADVVAHISGFQYATQSGSGVQMQQACNDHGPLSVCVDASTWQFYSGGIIQNNCGDSLDHCVQIVGWDISSQQVPYWIVRNSWGTSWGLSGYLYVERNEDECGISQEATYVTI